MIVRFPSYRREWASTWHRYYGYKKPELVGHFQYVRELLLEAGCDVRPYDAREATIKGHPEIWVDGKKVVVDIYEGWPILPNPGYGQPDWPGGIERHLDGVAAVFYLYSHRSAAKVFTGRTSVPAYPLGPRSYARWDVCWAMREIEWQPTREIYWAQRMHSWKRERAETIEKQIKRRALNVKRVRGRASFEDYLGQSLVCAFSLVVPGNRPDVVDKSQLQQMALGVPTMSSRLGDEFIRDARLIPGEHYVMCQDNFKDFAGQAEWCLENPDECRQIGANAREFFDWHCSPKQIVRWIEECLTENITN